MNKIIIEALKSAKPTVEQLIEVIKATANIEVATEILLGIYEDPIIESICKKESETEVNIQFISYDKFTKNVAYNYNRVECTKRWVANDKEAKIENACCSYVWADDAASFLKMEQKEFEATHTRHSFCSEPSDTMFHSTMTIEAWNGVTDIQKKK